MAMAGRGRKKKSQNSLGIILDFVDVVDATFERLTGKPVAAWLEEFRQRPRELPPSGAQTAPQQAPGMSLATAYMVLGLPQTASLEEVKRNYRNLAVVFHPDRGGYQEAMVLLNQAYEQIKREKGGEARC